MNAVTSVSEELIEPGQVAFVQLGVNRADYCFIEGVSTRGAVDVRPMEPVSLTWSPARRVSADDVLWLLTQTQVRAIQNEDRLPGLP